MSILFKPGTLLNDSVIGTHRNPDPFYLLHERREKLEHARGQDFKDQLIRYAIGCMILTLQHFVGFRLDRNLQDQLICRLNEVIALIFQSFDVGFFREQVEPILSEAKIQLVFMVTKKPPVIVSNEVHEMLLEIESLQGSPVMGPERVPLVDTLSRPPRRW